MSGDTDPNNDTVNVICPHCYGMVIVLRKEINCAIFRHAVYKTTMKHIDPHASKSTCDSLVQRGLVYGCGKPFKIINDVAEACAYI